MSIPSPGLGRALREAAYTVGATGVIICAFLVVRVWTQGREEDASTAQAARAISDRPAMIVGERLTVSGAEVGRSASSLLIVTSPSCQFCVSSAAFHRRLVEASQKSAIPVWIVVPTSGSARRFLSTFGLQNARTITWRDLSRRFLGVPSVVLVDSNGVIRRIWVGELRPQDESEVLAAVRDPHGVTPPRRRMTSGELILTRADLRTSSTVQGATVISILEREQFRQEHPPGSINIPLAELGMRAERDLRRDQMNVVDCSAIADAVCSMAVEHLRKKGFRTAAVDFGGLDEGR